MKRFVLVKLEWLFIQKWDHQYSLKGCKGSNIQGSALLADEGPDIQGSVQFGHELMFPSWKIGGKKRFVRIPYLMLVWLYFPQILKEEKKRRLKNRQI